MVLAKKSVVVKNPSLTNNSSGLILIEYNMTVVTLHYNPNKYKQSQQQKYREVQLDNQQVEKSLDILTNYQAGNDRNGLKYNEIEWLIHSKNVSERLNLLKESFKLVQSFRRKKSKTNTVDNDMNLSSYLSEDEASSGTDTQTGTPKRSSRRSLT